MVPSSKSNHLSKTPPLNIITLEVSVSIYEWGEVRNKHSDHIIGYQQSSSFQCSINDPDDFPIICPYILYLLALNWTF